jgi:hypothetical protein
MTAKVVYNKGNCKAFNKSHLEELFQISKVLCNPVVDWHFTSLAVVIFFFFFFFLVISCARPTGQEEWHCYRILLHTYIGRAWLQRWWDPKPRTGAAYIGLGEACLTPELVNISLIWLVNMSLIWLVNISLIWLVNVSLIWLVNISHLIG